MTTIDLSSLPTLPSLGCDPHGPSCAGQRRKLFHLCNEADLTKGERHTVASIILGRDIASFAELSHREASRLIDAVNGWHGVAHLVDTAYAWESAPQGLNVPCHGYTPDPDEFAQPASRADVDTILGHACMIGLSIQDVFDLALFVFGVEISDWTGLYPSGARRMITALHGYQTVEDVLAARPS